MVVLEGDGSGSWRQIVVVVLQKWEASFWECSLIEEPFGRKLACIFGQDRVILFGQTEVVLDWR